MEILYFPPTGVGYSQDDYRYSLDIGALPKAIWLWDGDCPQSYVHDLARFRWKSSLLSAVDFEPDTSLALGIR